MRTEIEELNRRLRAGRQELFGRVDWSSPGRVLLEAHSDLIDSLLRDIYELSAREAGRKTARGGRSGLAIVATGGYGRRELNPFSDVDIAFIPSEEGDPWVDAAVHTAFKLVMDVFLSLKDVRVGYSYRPAAEASSWDVSVKTSLLDLRPVCGDAALAAALGRRIREVLHPVDLALEDSARPDPPTRGGDRLYAVEPNLKDGPGGLRDLHRGRWIRTLLGSAGEPGAPPGHGGGAKARHPAGLGEAADWFWRARTWLHLASGRRSDVLMNSYQDRIARELGGCSAQEWLSRHLGYAEILREFHRSAVRAVLAGPLDVAGLCLEDGSLHLPQSAPGEAVALQAFHASQQYAIPISPGDLNRLGRLRGPSPDGRRPSEREIGLFRRILDERRGVAATLRQLAATGLLDRFLPGFSEAMRYVPPDPAHAHTVGEHSLRMVGHLEDLRAGRDRRGYRFKELLDQCSHFDVLCLAALLHDAGKLLPGDDHCTAGAAMTHAVAGTLGLPAEKRELLQVLVREHLLLVRTARMHDLGSGAVIEHVAARIPTPEFLRHLYVLTYVDTCAVSETNWTSMDVRDLEELYRKMQDFFARDAAGGRPPLEPERRIGLIRKKLVALHPSDRESWVLEHYDAMPAGYLLNTSLDEIACHMQLLDRLESEAIVLDVFNRPGDDYTELTICATSDSGPGMLAKIAGVLYGCAVDICRAQVYTMEKKGSSVLDTLWIRSGGMQISEARARRIQSALRDVLSGSVALEQFLQQAGRTPPGGVHPERVDLRNDLSDEHTVVRIAAGDIPGLLYVMCRSLSLCGLDIHSAKVTTWQARAENNFYVTTGSGNRIPDADLPLWAGRLRRMLRGGQGKA